MVSELKESWEGVSEELESRLSRVARAKAESGGGSLGEELVQLAVLGTAGEGVVELLSSELGEAGLGKLSRGVAKSSGATLSLLGRLPATVAALSDELESWVETGAAVSTGEELVSRELVLGARGSAGSLWFKLLELERVVERESGEMWLLLTWLQRALLVLLDKDVPEELEAQVGSSEAADRVVCFIKETFMQPWSAPKALPSGGVLPSGGALPLFRLERVGQYLVPGPLPRPLQACSEQADLFDSLFSAEPPHLYKANPSCSLVDSVEELKLRLEALFDALLHNNSQLLPRPTLVQELGPANEQASFLLRQVEEAPHLQSLHSTPDGLLILHYFSAQGTKLARSELNWAERGLRLLDYDFLLDSGFLCLLRKEERKEDSGLGWVVGRVSGSEESVGEVSVEEVEGAVGEWRRVRTGAQRGLATLLDASGARAALLNLCPDTNSTTTTPNTSRLSTSILHSHLHASPP